MTLQPLLRSQAMSLQWGRRREWCPRARSTGLRKKWLYTSIQVAAASLPGGGGNRYRRQPEFSVSGSSLPAAGGRHVRGTLRAPAQGSAEAWAILGLHDAGT